LEAGFIVWFYLSLDAPWKGCFPQGIKGIFEVLMAAIKQKAQSASPGCRVVNDFGHHRFVFTEIKFVADTNFTGRIDQHIPKTEFFVEFSEQEHFNLSTRFLLVAVQASGKHFGIVEDEYILFVEILCNFFEYTVFNRTGSPVEHHQPGFVPVGRRILGDQLFRQLELEL